MFKPVARKLFLQKNAKIKFLQTLLAKPLALTDIFKGGAQTSACHCFWSVSSFKHMLDT